MLAASYTSLCLTLCSAAFVILGASTATAGPTERSGIQMARAVGPTVGPDAPLPDPETKYFYREGSEANKTPDAILTVGGPKEDRLVEVSTFWGTAFWAKNYFTNDQWKQDTAPRLALKLVKGSSKYTNRLVNGRFPDKCVMPVKDETDKKEYMKINADCDPDQDINFQFFHTKAGGKNKFILGYVKDRQIYCLTGTGNDVALTDAHPSSSKDDPKCTIYIGTKLDKL